MGRSEYSIVAGQAAAARANRPAITVVMPFVGEWNEAVEAAVMLSNLDIGPGDELILVDNSGTVAGDDASTGALERSSGPDGPSSNSAEAFSRVRVVSATAERSPA